MAKMGQRKRGGKSLVYGEPVSTVKPMFTEGDCCKRMNQLVHKADRQIFEGKNGRGFYGWAWTKGAVEKAKDSYSRRRGTPWVQTCRRKSSDE